MKKIIVGTLRIAALGVLVGATGCTKKPSPENLDALAQQKSAADAAEAKVADLEQQKATLEQERADVNMVLEQHNDEFNELKQRK